MYKEGIQTIKETFSKLIVNHISDDFSIRFFGEEDYAENKQLDVQVFYKIKQKSWNFTLTYKYGSNLHYNPVIVYFWVAENWEEVTPENVLRYMLFETIYDRR